MPIINERASAIVALRPLEADPGFYHSAGVLRRHFSDEIIAAIKQEEAEAREFNKSIKEAALAMLSVDAAQYWADTQKLIARGKAAQAAGNQAWVDRVNRDSERLDETFDERVPDADKPKFKTLDLQRHAETWDPLWEYIEFPAPLLHDQFRGRCGILNVRNHAQVNVLRGVARDDVVLTPEEQDAARASALRLRRLAHDAHDVHVNERQNKDANANKRMYLRGLTKKQKKDRNKRLEAQEAVLRSSYQGDAA